MKLERLDIGGFFHFPTRAIVDLRNVPEGLVAIVGTNGHGKTRLLDAGPAAIYGPGAATGAFPSREGTLAEYATSRDAFIDALWMVEGDGRYRTRVNVDGVRRDSKAVLEQWSDNGQFWTPLNDGKVSTFREAVSTRFPSRQQLLASAFAAQGKQGSFVALDQRRRMELFAELLDLAHYATKCETAKACMAVADKARAALTAVRTSLERDTAQEHIDDLVARQQMLTSVKQAAQAEKADITQRIDDTERDRLVYVEQAAAHAIATSTLHVLDGQLAAFERDRTSVVADGERAAHDATTDTLTAERVHAQAKASIKNDGTIATQRFIALSKDLTERIANNDRLLHQADAIRRDAAALKVEQALLDQLRTRVHDQRVRLDELRGEQRVLDVRMAAMDHALRTLADAEMQASLLKDVPCGGVGEYAACQFLTRAAAAQARVPYLAEDTAGRPALLEQHGKLVGEVAAQEACVAATTADINRTERGVAGWKLAALEPHLAVAEEKMAGYKREEEQAQEALKVRLEELKAQQMAADATLAEALAGIRQRLATRQAETAAKLADIAAATEKHTLARQDALGYVERTRQAVSILAGIETDLRAYRAALLTSATNLAQADGLLAGVERQQDVLSEKQAELADTRDRLRVVDAELLSWSLLAKALGRDGLPKLEVDAAGPVVSNLCNDLLAVGYGTRFTVEVVTQVARADGKGLKESFDVSVFDNEYGGEVRSIADLSGGERVIVEEALRGAIALFVNSRNQRPIRTCWRDETTGALDAANVPRYVAMLRRIQQLGGFAHVLFVTHNADAAALADAQVRVRDGQPTVVLPPYGEVA